MSSEEDYSDDDFNDFGSSNAGGAPGGIGSTFTDDLKKKWDQLPKNPTTAVNESLKNTKKKMVWSIEVNGSNTTKRYGLLGSSLEEVTQSHETPKEARLFALKQIEIKKLKGYVPDKTSKKGGRGAAAMDVDDEEEEVEEMDDDEEGGVWAYLEYVAGNSSKFWQITLDGTDTIVRYGRIGANGSTSEKSHASEAAAVKFCEKMKGEKMKKGYEEADKSNAVDEGRGGAKKAKKPVKKAAVKKAPVKKAAAKKKKQSGGSALDGLTFSISGTLSMSRAEFKSLIQDNGGTFLSSVSKKIDYLVSTEEEVEKGTIKVNKAIEIGVPIVGEDFVVQSVEEGELQKSDDFLLE